MARKKPRPKATVPIAPRIHKATRESMGRVVRGEEISEAEAIALRHMGSDVVVCGADEDANRALASKIEKAVGPYKRQGPHLDAGPYALPHCQPKQRPPRGTRSMRRHIERRQRTHEIHDS